SPTTPPTSRRFRFIPSAQFFTTRHKNVVMLAPSPNPGNFRAPYANVSCTTSSPAPPPPLNRYPSRPTHSPSPQLTTTTTPPPPPTTPRLRPHPLPRKLLPTQRPARQNPRRKTQRRPPRHRHRRPRPPRQRPLQTLHRPQTRPLRRRLRPANRHRPHHR